MKEPIWEGVYSEFKDVPVTGGGFGGGIWVKNALQKAAELRELAMEEKTIPSVTRFHESLLPFLAAMVYSEKESVSILDFGGGIGLSYYQVKCGLPKPATLDFHVVDLEAVCIAGREFYSKESSVSFHCSLDECSSLSFDIVHIGSSIQYIEDWKGTLKSLCAMQADYIMLTNIPAGDVPTFATAQNYYGSKIASWFLNARDIIDVMKSYGFVLSFKSTYDLKILGVVQPYPQENFPEQYRMGYPCSICFRRER
ncbi:MAG: methyltransferase, TIGR04325 family [Nitrospirae bacterium]|nr:MAG: methyltransferase, TIGR04325 family [Nitrospirota bacterium]